MAKHLHFLDANRVQRDIAEGTVVHDGEVAPNIFGVRFTGATAAYAKLVATQDAVYKFFQWLGVVNMSNIYCRFQVVGYGEVDKVLGYDDRIDFIKNGNVVYTVNKGNKSAIGMVMRGVILI